MQNKAGNQKYGEYLQVIKECSPYDFSEYSNNSIDRRIEKIMHDNDLNMDQLIYKTRTSEEFVEFVVEAITVNTTELFRDPLLWKYLHREIWPSFKNKANINIWHAGCSTGQEVYSNMILLEDLGLLDQCNIYASDISRRAISKAKKGEFEYRFNIEKYYDNFTQVFEEDKHHFFNKHFVVNKEEDLLKVDESFIKKVKFVTHDLVKQEFPEHIKFDVIFCRNVLIYFNERLQTDIVQRFHNRLLPDGFLVLGAHELLDGFFKTKFTRSNQVYRKNNSFHFKY